MASGAELQITLPGGRRVDVQVGRHLIHTDQPLDNGGEDTAASPFQLFLASLGACAGIYVQGFCASRGLPTEGIRIVERTRFDDQGLLSGVELELQLPESFPARYREAVVRVVEQCAVKRAIQNGPDFNVRIGDAGTDAELNAGSLS